MYSLDTKEVTADAIENKIKFNASNKNGLHIESWLYIPFTAHSNCNHNNLMCKMLPIYRFY